MRCANKLLVFLLILVSFIENTTAQSVTDQQQVLYLRRLQLDGKFNSEFSFQQRAFFNSSVDLPEIVQQFSFGDKIAVKGLDSNQYQVRILPIQKLDVYNTHHIVTINDGSLTPSVGYQTQISGGVFLSHKKWSLQFRPAFQFAENRPYQTFYTNHADLTWQDYYQWINRIDMPERFGNNPVNQVLMGQSAIRYNLRSSSIGISTENIWWGPGYNQSLLMTNNAAGFPHLTYQSLRPLRTRFGSVEWQLISGKLKNSGVEPIEPRRVYDTHFLYEPKNNDNRFISGMMLSLQPSFLKGLHIGFAKMAYLYQADAKSPLDYLPLFGFFGIKTTAAEKANRKQMLGSIFLRYQMEKEKAEIYAEFGRNDKPMVPLFFMDELTVPTAFVAGFRKLFPLRAHRSNIELGLEFTQLSLNRASLINDVKSWYLGNFVRQGYTNNGKVIGSGIGPGGNSQLMEIAWNHGINRIALQVERRIHNNDFYYYTFDRIKDFRRHWVDAICNIKVDRQYKNFLFGGGLSTVRSLNYQWWYMEYEDFGADGSNYFKNGLDYITFQGQIYCNYRLDFRRKTARK